MLILLKKYISHNLLKNYVSIQFFNIYLFLNNNKKVDCEMC